LEHIAEVGLESPNPGSTFPTTWTQRSPDCDMVLIHDDNLARFNRMFDSQVSIHLIFSFSCIFPIRCHSNQIEWYVFSTSSSREYIGLHIVSTYQHRDSSDSHFSSPTRKVRPCGDSDELSSKTDSGTTTIAMFSEEYQEWGQSNTHTKHTTVVPSPIIPPTVDDPGEARIGKGVIVTPEDDYVVAEPDS
jgi:hypothetical protein